MYEKINEQTKNSKVQVIREFIEIVQMCKIII